MKYTREILASVVAKSISMQGVLRLLGLRPSGGMHAHLSRQLRKFGVSTGHFTGKASNKGAAHQGGPQRKSATEVLVLRTSGSRQTALRLRRALVESGVPYACARCGTSGLWQGQPLVLQVNHLDRNWLDDRISNLEFLCPNCHSQTEGWCGGKGGTDALSDAQQHRNRRVAKRNTLQI